MEINCQNCISSCCKLEVDLNEHEYKELCKLGVKESMATRAEMFIANNPMYADKKDFLNAMYGDTFAIIKKDNKGFCQLLDDKNRMCAVYEHRPQICRDYQMNGERCNSIKACIN